MPSKLIIYRVEKIPEHAQYFELPCFTMIFSISQRSIRVENPCVGDSIPPRATKKPKPPSGGFFIMTEYQSSAWEINLQVNHGVAAQLLTSFTTLARWDPPQLIALSTIIGSMGWI